MSVQRPCAKGIAARCDRETYPVYPQPAHHARQRHGGGIRRRDERLFNQAANRNQERFDEDCIFWLTAEEAAALRCKDNPSRVRVLEIYRDPAAYQAHLQTPHFKKFRAGTDLMVKSRKPIDATPVSFATKPGITT